MIQRTLAIVKPDGVLNKNVGNVITRIEREGFKIVAMRLHHLTRPEAEGFYAVHKDRPFFKDLVAFMTSGPVVLMGLEREDAKRTVRRDHRGGSICRHPVLPQPGDDRRQRLETHQYDHCRHPSQRGPVEIGLGSAFMARHHGEPGA